MKQESIYFMFLVIEINNYIKIFRAKFKTNVILYYIKIPRLGKK